MATAQELREKYGIGIDRKATSATAEKTTKSTAADLRSKYGLGVEQVRPQQTTRRQWQSETRERAEEKRQTTTLGAQEQRRQDERAAAAANRTNARNDYSMTLIQRDNLNGQADELQAEYDARIAAGEKAEDLADIYAKITDKRNRAAEYDKQAIDAYQALLDSQKAYEDIYADYNAARKELKEAERALRIQQENTTDSDYAANTKAAEERLANAREAFIAQGGVPDANVVSAGVLGFAAGVTDTVGYLQELAQPENERSWGIFTTGHADDARRHHQEVLQQREKEKYEAEHGAGTYVYTPGYQRTQEIAGQLAQRSAAETESMKAGRTELGQFAVDLGVQGVQMGADIAAGQVLPGGSLTAMALRSFGSGVREARNEGANIYQQGLYGAGTAAVEVLTEKVFDGVAGIYGAGAADGIISHAVGKFAKNELGRVALQTAFDALGEGFEEVASDMLNPFLRRIYDEHVFDNGYFGALNGKEILYDFLVGAAMGAIGGSVETVAQTTGLSAPDERSEFFMRAGESGMDIGDAMRMWQKHMLKTGYAFDTSDSKITEKAKGIEQSIDEKRFDPFRERRIRNLNESAARQITREDIDNTVKAVRGRMKDLGVENDDLAMAIAAVALEGEAERIGAGGGWATEEQRAMVKAYPEAQQILSEMNVEDMRTAQRIEYAAYLSQANPGGGVTKEQYEAEAAPYVRDNAWVRSLEGNKALATDVYGHNNTVSEAEKTGRVTIKNKNGSTIQGDIVGVKDGKVKIKHGKGNKYFKEVDVANIQGISDSYRALLEAAVQRKHGSAMLKAYKPGQDVGKFVTGWNLAENTYGALTGVTAEQARSAFLLRELTDTQLDVAFQLGREGRKENVEKASRQKLTGEVEYWKGGNIEGRTYDAVTAEEAKALLGADEFSFVTDVLSKIANVTLIKSQEKNGSFTGAQGIFYQDGRIYLDVNAGMNSAKDIGQRTIVLAAAHELTHFIRAYNEDGYKVLRDFITERLTAKGMNIQSLVDEKIRRSGNTLDPEAAMEEVIADACETMLTDTTQIKQFASEHAEEAKQIWGWLDKFLTKLKSKFEGLTGRHAESIAMQDSIDELRQKWFEALAQANNAAEASNPSDTVFTSETESGFGAVTESNGTAMSSLRTFEESGRDALYEFLNKQVESTALTEDEAKQMRAQIEELYRVCKDYDNGTYAPFSAWSNASVVTYDGRPVFSVVKQNGEYKLNLDFSLVCKKRRTLDAVFNEMIRRGIMNDFNMGPGSIAKINQIIREHGFETACGLCFVDSKRYRQAMIADAFCAMYNMQVFSLMKGTGAKVDSFNYGGDATIVNSGMGIDTLPDDKLNWTRIDEILRTEKKGTVRYKIAEYLKNNPKARKLVSRGDFMSTAGFDALKANNPELLSLYNSKKGAGGPKAAQSDVQYLNEIIQQGKFNVKDAYEVGGVRIQSFSDYVGRLVFDYVQMVADLSAKKLPAHSYTKEFMFAQQFGLTGIKINMSLVPAVVKGGVAAGLDANGDYAWKDGQSFGSTVYDNKGKRMTAAEGFQLAIQIQNAEGYSKNCGTIAVGVSNAHILKMLDDPNIRMIIPYHKSGLNHLVAAMEQIDKYTDYTNVQNTMRKNASGKWVKIAPSEEFNWNDTLQRMEKQGKGAKEAAQEYIKWCKEHGYRPKFDTDTLKFSEHPNYYKMLADFSCYDADGTTATPLGAVQMVFPTESDAFGSMQELIKAGLEEDAMLQAKQEGGVDDIVEEIQSVLPAFEAGQKKTGAKYSSREDVRALKDVDWMDNFSSIKDQLEKHRGEIEDAFGGNPIVEIEYLGEKEKALDEAIMEQAFLVGELSEDGESALFDRDGIGFEYNKSGVRTIRTHASRNDALRAAAIISPHIAKKGIRIAGQLNHENTGFPTLTYAAPALINGTPTNVGVVIQFQDDGKPRAVNVETSDGGKFVIKKEDTARRIRGRVDESPGTTPPRNAVSSKVTIPQTSEEINSESGKMSERDNATAQKTKEHYEERISRLRAEKNARIEEIRREEAARRKEVRSKEKALKKEKVQETKEYYRDMMKRQRGKRSDTAVRGKIKALHKELSDMLLNPKEGRYVPKELVKATAEILGAVDTTSKRAVKAKDALARLRVQYDALKEDQKYAVAYDETVSGMLQEIAQDMGEQQIYELTGTDLEGVYNTLKALKHAIRTANQLVGSQIEATAFEAASQMMDEAENAKGISLKYLRKFIFSQLSPERFGNLLSGYRKNGMWKQMMEMLNEGQRAQTQIMMEGGQIFRELIDDKKSLANLHDRKNLVDIGLKDRNGNAVKITRGMMLSVYMHLLNEDNARHIAYGGFTVPKFAEYYKGKMTDAFTGKTGRAVAYAEEMAELSKEMETADEARQEEIKERLAELEDMTASYLEELRSNIEEQLTEYDRKWIEAAQYFFDEYSKQKLNEVTEMVYGFEKAQVDHYFPIHTDQKFRTASFDSIARDMSLENAGFMKKRVYGANPIQLEDITDVVSSQLRKTAQYVGLMPAIRNFNKAYGKARAGYSMSVQEAVSQTFGNEGLKYIENLMADLNGARRTEADIFDEIRGNVAGAALMLSPRVTLAQTASYPTAAAEIGYAPLIKALKDIAKNPMFNSEAAEEIAKWTPLWWYRMQGFRDTELGDIKANEQFMNKLMDRMKWATGWIQFADGLTTGGLWQASKYYVDEKFSDLEKGSEEYFMKVAETYNRVIEATQPNYTTMQRPDILRNPNKMVKQFTMFLTQRLQNFNLMYDAVATYNTYAADLRNGRNGVTKADVKAAGTKLAWTMSSQIVASSMIVMFKYLADRLLHNMKAYRDDDDEITEESTAKALLWMFGNTITSNILLGSEVFDIIKRWTTGDKYYGISLSAVEAINDVATAIANGGYKLFHGEDASKEGIALAKKIGQAFGIPVNNAIKIVDAIRLHYEDIENGEFGSFEAGVDRSKAQNTHLLYEAYQSGNTAKAKKLEEEFDSKQDIRSQMKSYLKTLYTDPNKGDNMRKNEVITLLQKYCGMTRREAEDTAQQWTMEVVTGTKYSDLQSAYIEGSIPKAQAVKYYKTYSSNGHTTDAEAEEKVMEWTCEKDTGIKYSDIPNEVKTGRLSAEKAIQMLMKYGGKSEDAATKTVNGYAIEHEYNIKPSELEDEYVAGNVSDEDALDILERYKYYGKENAQEKANEEMERMQFVREYPEAEDMSITQVRNYNASGLNGYVSPEDYLQAAKMMGTFHGLDEDGNGKTDPYSVVMQKLEYIDSMDLDPERKTALALSLGINEKTVKRKAPWL